MPDAKKLPALLSLLDDEDESTQQAIGEALLEFGPALRIELARLQSPPTEEQRAQIQTLMAPLDREILDKEWPGWSEDESEVSKLETGLAQLSEYLSGYEIPEGLFTLLDRLADAYGVHSGSKDPLALAEYLFQHLEFKGEDQNFYHPRNSDLCRVIRNRRGNPISLASLYMLVGRRLGMPIGGCNFPGHFLARVEKDERVLLVDCFNGGTLVDHKLVAGMSEQGVWGVQETFNRPATAKTMLVRVLTNLLRAFQENGARDDAALMTRLLARMDPDNAELPGNTMLTVPGKQPQFQTGQLVRHQRYGYRGVIVDFDMVCRADDAWYRRNRTQPDRNQPWYHVLVDQTDQATYAAESSLLADDSQEEIFHPLVPHYFEQFEKGRYVRNTLPWQGL